MPSPVVTLVLPIYNMERFLRESILSIRAQTFTDLEVIAILDGCTDGSEEILNEQKDERFRVIKNDQNQGVGAATNLGLQQARGEFFGRMDADDVMEPERLRKEVEFLCAHSDIDVVGTYFDTIDEMGRKIGEAFPFQTEPDAIREEFRTRGALHHPTALFRTQRIRDVGGYFPTTRYAEDLSLWLRCLAKGYQLANIPEVLLHYRQHSSQLMSRKLEPTLAAIDAHYVEFGSQIWGKDAPDYVAGVNLLHRRWRRLKRTVKRMTQ